MKNQRLKLIFHQWCEVTTCNGVLDWFLAKHKCGKYFWATVLTLCALITVLMITVVVYDYTTSNKYKTSVWIEPVTGIKFPNITICNFNRAKSSVIRQFGISYEALSYAFGSLLVFYDFPMTVMDDGNISKYEIAWEELTKLNSSLADVRNLLDIIGYKCQDIFWSCTWRTRLINCCDHVTEVINSYGKCFILSPPVDHQGNDYPSQKTPGISQGLKLVLDPQLIEYPTNLIVNNFVEAGFVVSADYVYEPLLPNPIAVGPGIHAYISLETKVETIAEPNYPVAPLPCRRDLTLQILNQSYSKQNCILDCALISALDKCGCLFFSDFQRDYPICNASAGLECIGSGLQRGDISLKECTETCITPCQDFATVSSSATTTRFQFTTLPYPIKSFLIGLGVNAGSEDVAPTLLDIYFPRLEILNVETSEYTPVLTFISNIGGQLGLWLGISVVTVVQMIYYVFLCLVERNKQKTTQIK